MSLPDCRASAEQQSFTGNKAWIMSSSSSSSPHTEAEQKIVKVSKLGGYFRTVRLRRGVLQCMVLIAGKVQREKSKITSSISLFAKSFLLYFWVQITECLSSWDCLKKDVKNCSLKAIYLERTGYEKGIIIYNM